MHAPDPTRHLIILPRGLGQLYVGRPEVFPILLQATSAAGGSYPTQQQLAWFEKTIECPKYNNRPQYWSPYGHSDGGIFIKPWYSSAYNYARGTHPTSRPVNAVSPEMWRQNAVNMIKALNADQMDTPVGSAMRMARDQWLDVIDPEVLAYRNALDLRVKEAQNGLRLVFKTKTARDMLGMAITKYGDVF